MRHCMALVLALAFGQTAAALDLDHPFEAIDGGALSLSQWAGQPILVVNTASRCAYTRQYAGLQDLYDTYKARGLVVLAVPSNDFRQELSTNAEVKEFCELQYDLDLPMTGITPILGTAAHPLYQSLKTEEGFVPAWNFNKVLIGPTGDLVATYGSGTKPSSGRLRRDIEALLK